MASAKDILTLMDSPSADDAALVTHAYEFAQKAHDGHKRFSGEPYFVHLVETAKGLATLGMGPKTIAAGLLHDSVEDVGVSPQDIEKEFGKDVRFLVEGVTKLGQLKYRGAARHRESLRKLLVATSKDVRVLIIKLMDRLHNMRTLAHVPEEKRKRIALETLEIYTPIAHRLGIGVIRRELEDLAFEYADPDGYKKTKSVLTERSKETLLRLEKLDRTLKRSMGEAGITSFRSDYRVKGLYSLYRKLARKEGNIDKVYDLAALRVIVPTIADCYRVLGIVHSHWRPLPNKIKDYIAFPKPNGYQSLHTTVFAGDGGIVEVQIRTEKMHQEAEFGIATHVLYKEGAEEGSVKSRRSSSFEWIKSLIPGLGRQLTAKAGEEPDTQTDPKDHRERRYSITKVPEWVEDLGEHDDEDFETSIRSDIFNHRVFAFTPKGDVVDLPVQSSPVDFAFAIHSDIGNHISGAKVNGKLVPLDTVLHNGDIVEIITKRNAKPTRKWLDFAKTTLARRHIRLQLEKETGRS
jgi:GTP diphosphokinase / guanosine-3',5'-bis(diphosphate) 3'-diphosphatase